MTAQRKVGIMFLVAVAMVLAFAWLMGTLNPFSNTYTLYVQYNFAGGIETGSPVRVMGIKVGKVERIDFDVNQKDAQGQEVKLRVKISLDKKVKQTVRKDSRFFINLAGIIGEKFLEVTPGTSTEPELENGMVVRGEDPPRIDQLISQSYGLAGKVIEMLNKNEGSVSHTIELFDGLVTNLNRSLIQIDKTTKNVEIARMLRNAVEISEAIRELTDKTRTPEGKRTLELLHNLIWRLEPMDKAAIKKFLQEEGIRAKIF